MGTEFPIEFLHHLDKRHLSRVYMQGALASLHQKQKTLIHQLNMLNYQLFEQAKLLTQRDGNSSHVPSQILAT